MNIVIIVTGSIVGVAYLTELFVAWYSGVEWEQYAFLNRATGPMAWSYWIMMSCNVLSPQLFWFKKIRTSIVATFILSIVVNIGMWFERFVIIVPTLCRTYLPSIGMFGTFFLLFSRYFPVIAQAELKTILKSSGQSQKEAAKNHH